MKAQHVAATLQAEHVVRAVQVDSLDWHVIRCMHSLQKDHGSTLHTIIQYSCVSTSTTAIHQPAIHAARIDIVAAATGIALLSALWILETMLQHIATIAQQRAALDPHQVRFLTK